MKIDVTPVAFRWAVYPTFGLSLLVLLAPAYLGGLKQLLDFITTCSIQIGVGCSVMILVIECVGVPLRAGLNQFGAGILFAFFVYISGVVSVCAAAMFAGGGFDLGSYAFGVLYLGTCGVLPSAVFGLIGTAILRMNGKTLPSNEPNKATLTRIPHFKP